MNKQFKLFLTILGLFGILSCGGGGGGVGNSVPSYSCTGDGFTYFCTPNVSGGSTPTPPPASPFPISASIQNLVSSGINASGLDIDPYTQAGTFAVTKAVTPSSFNGQSVTQLRTTTTWPSTSVIVPSWTGYIAPYDFYYDSNNLVYGFHINGIYGLKTSGATNPISVNDGANGTLGSYNLFTDSALTIRAGTANLTYSVNNCCDLWNKVKATMKLVLTASTPTATWTLTQGFVVTTSGGISFSGEQLTDTSTKRIYYPTGGY